MMGINQSYQELSRVILKELMSNPVDFKTINYQKYFYDLKIKEPENYEKLFFDKKGSKPYSEGLSEIFGDFILSGFIDLNKNIITKSLEKISEYLNFSEEKEA